MSWKEDYAKAKADAKAEADKDKPLKLDLIAGRWSLTFANDGEYVQGRYGQVLLFKLSKAHHYDSDTKYKDCIVFIGAKALTEVLFNLEQIAGKTIKFDAMGEGNDRRYYNIEVA